MAEQAKPKIVEIGYSVLCLESDAEEVRESLTEWFANHEISMYGGLHKTNETPRIPKGAEEFFVACTEQDL